MQKLFQIPNQSQALPPYNLIISPGNEFIFDVNGNLIGKKENAKLYKGKVNYKELNKAIKPTIYSAQ